MKSTHCIFATLLLVAPACLHAQELRLLWDPNSYLSEGHTPVGEWGTFYVFAMQLGQPGVIGAEYRIEGLPAGWPATVVPNSAANYLTGDPLHGGCQISFPLCLLPDERGHMLLHTIQYLAATPVANQVISVLSHSTPSNPNYSCPVLIGCDAPAYTYYCATGSYGVLNATVGVEQHSWTRVKALYE